MVKKKKKSKQHLPAYYVAWVLERKRRQTVMEIRFPGSDTIPYDGLAGEWVHNRTVQRIFWWAWTCSVLHCSISLCGHMFPHPFLYLSVRLSPPRNLPWSVKNPMVYQVKTEISACLGRPLLIWPHLTCLIFPLTSSSLKLIPPER